MAQLTPMTAPKHPYMFFYIQMVAVIVNIIFGIINSSIQGNEWVVALNFGVASFVTILAVITLLQVRRNLANIEQFNADVERFNEVFFY